MHCFWSDIDDETVERLIAGLQATVAALSEPSPEGGAHVAARDLTAALLTLLASVLATSPACVTPMGMRRTAEAAGKELLTLMRETHALRAHGGVAH